MITDSEDLKQDQRFRTRLFQSVRSGPFYSHLNNLIEDPLFTDSKWRNLSQLVDCIAYCIRKQYRPNTESVHTHYWQHYYEKLESKFDNPFGSYKGYGLKIFP
jgi:hypothetical protein